VHEWTHRPDPGFAGVPWMTIFCACSYDIPHCYEGVISRLLLPMLTLAGIDCGGAGTGRWKGVIVAIKVVEHSTSTREESLSTAKQRIDRESVLSTSLAHPNVISTYKICTINTNRFQHFDSASQAAGRNPHLAVEENADPLAIPWET
jgi:hypothetical protein